jgi:hypothetical protein
LQERQVAAEEQAAQLGVQEVQAVPLRKYPTLQVKQDEADPLQMEQLEEHIEHEDPERYRPWRQLIQLAADPEQERQETEQARHWVPER